MTKERGKSLNGYPRQSVAAAVPAAIAGDTPATTKAGECLMLLVLRTRRRRIREYVMARRDWPDRSSFVDGIDAVLQTLEEVVCVPGRRGFVICETCARRWFAPPIWRRAHTTARRNSGEAYV